MVVNIHIPIVNHLHTHSLINTQYVQSQYVTLPMLMYEYYRGYAGDTGGYGVSIYVHCNRSGFADGCMGFLWGLLL